MTGWMEEELRERQRQGLFRRRRRPRSAQGPVLTLNGRSLLNFSSNDYLGLASDPRLARAAARAARRFGTGAGASALVSGHLPPLRALERTLAQWEETEAALVFSSGFATNLALIPSLVGREDAIFSDELNHASLIDGCRLARARVHVYRHADSNHLADLLAREGRQVRRRLIVSDTVFSMDGDLACLPDLYDLAQRYGALLVLDEAHATGVLGEHGRGVCELFPPPPGLDPDTVLRVGTLSKALGAQGGFLSGSRRLITWLVNVARPYIFSTALAPPTAAAAREAIRIVQQEPERRQQVQRLTTFLRAQLHLQPMTPACPIVPIVLGDSRRALAVSRSLQAHGILAPAIRPPSVPTGTARLRVSLSADHRLEDLQRFLEVLREQLPALT